MSSANDDGVHTHARPTTANLQRRRRAPSAGDGAMVYFASGDRFCFLFSITMRVHTHTHSHFSTTLFELSGLLRICGTCGGTGGKCQQADGFENSCCCAHRTGALNGFGLVRCACRCLYASPRHSLCGESLNIHFRLWR